MLFSETAASEAPAVVTEDKETPAAKAKSEAKVKISRRLSARVNDFLSSSFKSKPKTEITTPAKVDEHPPKIDKPEAIGPLEDLAADAPKVEESAKPVEASAPVVAAAA
jgi:hypothetical protein